MSKKKQAFDTCPHLFEDEIGCFHCFKNGKCEKMYCRVPSLFVPAVIHIVSTGEQYLSL